MLSLKVNRVSLFLIQTRADSILFHWVDCPCILFYHVCIYIVGAVQPVGEPLTSPFQKEFLGVLQKFMLKEHRLVWNSLSRTW